MKCPICEENSSYVIIDLHQCESCNHIFKKNNTPIIKYLPKELHLYSEPIKELRTFSDAMEEGETMQFEFPSMILYDIEISPNDFYNNKFLQYYNQHSLMILLKRCGLTLVHQTNEWQGTIALTKIKVKK